MRWKAALANTLAAVLLSCGTPAEKTNHEQTKEEIEITSKSYEHKEFLKLPTQYQVLHDIGDKRCSEGDLIFAEHQNISSFDIKYISTLPGTCSDHIFALQDLRKIGKTADDLKFIYTIATEDGKPIFDDFFDLRQFVKHEGNEELIRAILSLKHPNGKKIQWGGNIWVFAKEGFDPTMLQRIANTPDSFGEYSFADGEALIGAAVEKVNPSQINKLCSLAKFDAYSFLDFINAKGTANDVAYWHDITDDGVKITNYKKLGVRKEEVMPPDTQKPNALVILPRWDHNGTLTRGASIKFYEELRKRYDVTFRVCETDEEMYRAMDEAHNVKLLITAGHGSRSGLTLGLDKQAQTREDRDEKYEFDIFDSAFFQHLQNIEPDAAIFINACDTAEGGPGEHNFANFIKSGIGNRKLYASQASFAPDDMKVDSYYPFRLRIICEKKDVTFVK